MTQQHRTVAQWVDYIQTLHHREIELGLDRVESVYRRLYPNGMACKVISVAGTNGKGSTAELISSIYNQAGYKVGKFTSPHLINFGERYSINGSDASDDALLAAFEKIETARASVPITYFEYGALLAIELFSAAKVDVAVMEVGLGGRLDAINILDADISIIKSISIAHTAWLGDTVEEIAREKAGIARTNKPCIVGIRETPNSIIEHCQSINADLQVLERDFDYQLSVSDELSWSWRNSLLSLDALPLPFRQKGVQLSNASLAIHATQMLSTCLPVAEKAIHAGLKSATILARCQVVSELPLVILDVAHNESSVKRLREFVEQQLQTTGGAKQADTHKAKVFAVCGMLKDKEIAKSLGVLTSIVDQWFFAGIDNERGASAIELEQQLALVNDDLSNVNHQTTRCYTKILDAYNDAIESPNKPDVIIVFGSFFVAGDILQAKA